MTSIYMRALNNDKEAVMNLEEDEVRRLKSGGEDELRNVIRKYTPYVSAVIARALGGLYERESVEEAAADVFYALWKNRDSIDTYNLKGYLAAAARNRARDFMRRKMRPEPERDDFYVELDDSLEKWEREKMLGEALGKLDDTDREILVRFYYYEESTAQIALIMNLKREGVKSRLKRGREKLKKILEDGGYEN